MKSVKVFLFFLLVLLLLGGNYSMYAQTLPNNVSTQRDTVRVYFDAGLMYNKHVNFFKRDKSGFAEFNKYHEEIVRNDRFGGGGFGFGISVFYKRNILFTELNRVVYLETYHTELYNKEMHPRQQNEYYYNCLYIGYGRVLKNKKQFSFYWKLGGQVEFKSKITGNSNILQGNVSSNDGSKELFNYYQTRVYSVVSDFRASYQLREMKIFINPYVGYNLTDVMKDDAPFSNHKFFIWVKVGIMLPLLKF